MEVKTYKLVIVFAVIVLGLIAYSVLFKRNECKSRVQYDFRAINEEIDLDSLFRPIATSEINEQLRKWRNFKSSPDSYREISEIVIRGREGVLIEVINENRKHYAAIIAPKNIEKEKKYPLVIWANGLNQKSPTVSTSHRPEISSLLQKLPDYFLLIPSFRGQSLEIGGKLYCSDGFFGDAFDGATDDALRALQGAISNYENIDNERLAIYGVSRGGTVALLTGIRNSQIRCVIAQSGPTDFLGQKFLDRYSLQYRYQFISPYDNVRAMRTKILASSPLHFISEYQNHLMIAHGTSDAVVPVFHAEDLIKATVTDHLTTMIVDAGHNMYGMDELIDWLRINN